MKQLHKFSGSIFKINLSKSVMLLLLASLGTTADAQENRGHEQRQSGEGARTQNHSQQMPAARQGNPATRQQPVSAGNHAQGSPNASYHNRPQPNDGHSTQHSAQPNVAARTPEMAHRPPINSPGVSRPNRPTTYGANPGRTNPDRIHSQGTNRVHYTRPPYSASNPSWRYANVPRRNSVITTVPVTYRTISYSGYNYRYNNGIFYRPYNNTYIVVAPPVGLHISILPVGYRRIYVNKYPYYYYNGTYYDNRNNDYLVVSPPVGAIVESLPAGYETLTIDGQTYYTVDGAQYKPVVQDNGELWYEVIKAN